MILKIRNFRYDRKVLDIDKSRKIIEINPLLLSFNFYHIFKGKMVNDKTFKLILNEDRNKFIRSITDFINSKKKITINGRR